MRTKLILVEGLPSTGKTTTAEIVHQILNERNIENEIFVEGNLNHPADYDGVAFLDEKEFTSLLQSFEFYVDQIYDITIKKEAGYFIEYKKGMKKYRNTFPSELWNQFFANDIYELPLETHVHLLKEKWNEFAMKADKEDKVYIFDCVFIQNPVTISMIRDNVEKNKIIHYIKEIENIIKILNPILLYVKQKDIHASFKRAIDERPKEWLKFFIDYYTKQAYGKSRGYKGLEGVMNILTERENLEAEVVELLNISTHLIDNSAFNMEQHKGNIYEKIKNRIE